jgi:hypothetical protein
VTLAFPEPSDNLSFLLAHRHNFLTVSKQWDIFAWFIKEYCEEAKFHRGGFPVLPKPTIDKEARSIEITFTDVKLICRFRHSGDGAILFFGYAKNKNGREKFKNTNNVYLDRLGNILNEEDGKTTDLLLRDGLSVNGVYFKGCRQALEVAYTNNLCRFCLKIGFHPCLTFVGIFEMISPWLKVTLSFPYRPPPSFII